MWANAHDQGERAGMARLLAYLQLCRFAAVFTALADIFLGFALSERTLRWDPQLGWLLLASSGLYLSGMVLNDVFDRKVDAVERPARPIPSGRVSLRAAIALGIVLMIAGVVAAALAGPASLFVAVALVVCILLYDGWAKQTIAGPLVMGSCRLLNVVLGASVGSNFVVWPDFVREIFAMPQLPIAAGMGVYIAGVTWFARNEAGTSKPAQLLGATIVIDLGIAWLIGFVLRFPTAYDTGWRVAWILAIIAFTLNRRLIPLIRPVAGSATPGEVQGAIRILLLSVITLDASLLFFVTGFWPQALIVLALLIPAMTLGRLLAIT